MISHSYVRPEGPIVPDVSDHGGLRQRQRGIGEGQVYQGLALNCTVNCLWFENVKLEI